MSSLSAVVEKLIHGLGLTEFPCGPGPWRWAVGGEDRADTEDTGSLLDFLDSETSPWHQDQDWSPQAASLRRLAVLSPKALTKNTINGHFTTLRISDKDVCVIDEELVRFTKLEELVLSANSLTDVPSRFLPASLRVLEVRNNHISSLSSLTSAPPPSLLYLGLAWNPLSSAEDISHLTGLHWPALVCLDLRFCDYSDQCVLLGALSSLPCLRSLLLEGNPFSLTSSYPGLTIDSLPQISCLDTQWISVEERQAFKGLAHITGVESACARATLRLGRLQGIPDPRIPNECDFPLVSFSYSVSYDFYTHSLPDKQGNKCETMIEDTKVGLSPEVTREAVDPCIQAITGEHVSSHSTHRLPWSECIDFSETQTHVVKDLRGFKSFLNQGMCIRVEEEKILSWPVSSEDAAGTKPGPKETKAGKGKETPNKAVPTKDKPKDKKKKALPELVQDAPIRRTLVSQHVPLHSLLQTGQRLEMICDFGPLALESHSHDKDVKVKEEKKKEESKRGRGGSEKKNTAAKGKGKPTKESDEGSVMSSHIESVSVELWVDLGRWKSAAEAQLQLTPSKDSNHQPLDHR